jgi:hypothetical protein
VVNASRERSTREKASSGHAGFAGGGYADSGEVVDRAFVLAEPAADTVFGIHPRLMQFHHLAVDRLADGIRATRNTA